MTPHSALLPISADAGLLLALHLNAWGRLQDEGNVPEVLVGECLAGSDALVGVVHHHAAEEVKAQGIQHGHHLQAGGALVGMG